MIVIENGIPIGKKGKYTEYYCALEEMKSGQSFTVDSMLVVDAIRGYAWKNKIKMCFKTIKNVGKPKFYRIWKL